jgi:ATP-binding cassette subfamily C protein LapB
MAQNPATLPEDSLLQCLLLVAGLHDRPLTATAATAGLPLERQRLTPALFERAAERAGLFSKLVRLPLAELDQAVCPIVLLLADEQAVVFLGNDPDSGEARLLVPGQTHESRLDMAELARRYAGHALYLRPDFRFDARTPEVGQVGARHWFWSVLLDNRALYRDVLLASLLINLFSLALPLFVMNVYDRVVPNHATSTLWAMAIGVGVVLIADLVLRTMRGYFLDLAGQRVDVRISTLLMQQVLGQRLEHRPQSAGAFASNLRSFETVRDFMTSATLVVVIDIPFALLFLVFIAWISLPLVVPILIGGVLLLIYAWTVQGRMHELTETTYRAGAQRNATLIESLVGIETIKAHALEGWMQRKWERTAAFLAATSHHLRLLSAATTYGAQWVVGLTNVAMIVIGVYLIHDHALSLGGSDRRLHAVHPHAGADRAGGRADDPVSPGQHGIIRPCRTSWRSRTSARPSAVSSAARNRKAASNSKASTSTIRRRPMPRCAAFRCASKPASMSPSWAASAPANRPCSS